MSIRVGVVIVDGSDFRPGYREVSADNKEDGCVCGSVRFINFEKTQYATGIAADQICLGCGLVYRFDWMRRVYVLSERGGTESSVSYAQWFIHGIHDERLISSR